MKLLTEKQIYRILEDATKYSQADIISAKLFLMGIKEEEFVEFCKRNTLLPDVINNKVRNGLRDCERLGITKRLECLAENLKPSR